MSPSGGGSKVEPTCGPRAAPRKGKRRATPPPWQTERERPALRHASPTYAWFFLREKEHHIWGDSTLALLGVSEETMKETVKSNESLAWACEAQATTLLALLIAGVRRYESVYFYAV
jgi:hypothetical protein